MLRNVIKQEEIETRDDYTEIEKSVEEEMHRFGVVITVHTPKPLRSGDTTSV
jgi:hypothetical protein